MKKERRGREKSLPLLANQIGLSLLQGMALQQLWIFVQG